MLFTKFVGKCIEGAKVSCDSLLKFKSSEVLGPELISGLFLSNFGRSPYFGNEK